MSDIFPCFYILSLVGGYFLQTREADKLGTTWHPSSRKAQFATAHAQAPYFKHVFKLDPIQFSTNADLYKLDSIEWIEFLRQKNLMNIHVQLDGGKEFFWTGNLVELVREFLLSQNYRIIEEIADDPFPIRIYTSRDKQVLHEEEICKDHILERVVQPSLYKQFLDVFLPGKLPRRVQLELWDRFEEICSNPETIAYSGIVQWPTGVGKTIAILMLIVISAERCKRRCVFYRGLFVSPKNDILDTITGNFDKLSKFGITLYDGSHGKLSKLTIPLNQNLVVMACQKALTNEKGLAILPPITHVHYDEAHRITGQLYFTLLKQKLNTWKTEILTGTSATPFTSSASQREKITELFGEPLTIIHRCGVDEAVQEGWIAKPRFLVSILPPIDKTDAHLRGFVSSVGKYIRLKNTDGKYICYIETSTDDVRRVAEIARKMLPLAQIYTAIDGERTDQEFLDVPISKTPSILFACQRYREGSDIRGLEMTAKLLGNKSAAYIILQICGRAARIDDNKEKEGWCLLVRPSEEGTTEQEILESIILDIMEFLENPKRPLTKREIERLVETYLGSISLSGTECTIEETIARVQAAYVRREYVKRTPKEKYSLVREQNKELGLVSRLEYREKMDNHPAYIEDPQIYFKDWWVSWYHFLGIDTSSFPNTKAEWIRVCKERNLLTWDQYKTIAAVDLPLNPSEFYEDFTNWDKEMGVEDEIVW